MTTPTCQVCGTALKLDDGISIETVIRRGEAEGDPDYEEWNQELCFRFCGEQHMRTWMSTLSLPAYEPPADEKSSPLESFGDAVAASVMIALLLVVLTGAVYGFLLLLARVF